MAAIASTDDVATVGEDSVTILVESFVLLMPSSYESCLEYLEHTRGQILVPREHLRRDDFTSLLFG